MADRRAKRTVTTHAEPENRPKRLGRPPATDGDVTRQRIIETAQQRFGERGYDRATNNDIAVAAGLTSGSIYHYFGSKSQLYNAVASYARVLILERLEHAIDGEDTLAGRVVAILDTALELHLEHPYLSHFLINAPTEASRNPDIRACVEEFMAALSELFCGLVDDAAADGELDADTDPMSVGLLMQAIVFGLGQFSTLASSESVAAVVAQCARLIDGTLFRPSPTAATRISPVR